MINSTILRTTLSAAAVILAFGSSSAMAQKPESSGTRFFQGLYLSGAVGAHRTADSNVSGGSLDVEAETDSGLAGLVGLGLQLGATNWRVELEGGYRESDIDNISGVGATGDVDVLSIMGNVFYDISLTQKLDFYLGGGLGLADVDLSNAGTFGTATIDDNDMGWAWQLGAGAAFALNERLKLTLDYRFLNIEDLDYPTSPAIGELDVEYRDHAIFVGLRFDLTPAAKPMLPPAPKPVPPARQTYRSPPPPPPPPAPEPPRNFIVFFDWDRSDITPEAAAILRDAAATAQRGEPVRIVATGHADRSGTTVYNRALSERRALAVRAELQRRGINPSTVSTFARGETDPLVPTPDGVREPQNRRVELVLQ
ncbi:MAG: outer membrane beta-barrel protein [Alphaproteobacteria bacterium]|nr:outer membrane beta-barrel protein [Alphaproteobacteria bacterium]MCZ6839085.1 outer membrane beta-barrel protein [Alphaproteobacteria bacterium]